MPKHYLDLIWNDPHSRARGYLVIHRLTGGIAGGGCRMREGCSFDEVAHLAQTMSLKFGLYQVPIGGASAGIDYDPTAADADRVLDRFFSAIAPYLRESYITGPDIGLNEAQILGALGRIGIPARSYPAIRHWNLAPDCESLLRGALAIKAQGMALDGFVAGYGIAICARQALECRGTPVRGARVALQGFGSVGGAAARFLAAEGARIVAVADIAGTIACRDGMDVELLLGLRDSYGVIDREKLPANYLRLGPDAWFTEPSDVLIPAAVPDAIDFYRADLVNSSIVVEGANAPLTAKAEQVLYERGVTIIPDLLANSAFAFILGTIVEGGISTNADVTFDRMASRLRECTDQVLEGAARGISPRERVIALAQENLAHVPTI